MFIDSHAHLEAKRFDHDREEVMARARAAGVEAILAIGIGEGPGTLDCAIQLAERFSQIYATTGIHPHEARLAKESDFAEMERLARHGKVIAWGEIGLDYFYDYSPRPVQTRVFQRQMELARAAKLPIVIHCRASQGSDNAWDDTIRLLRENWASSGLGGVLHCFTGSLAHARAALELGFLISFAGNLTFPNAQSLRDVAQKIPLDRLLIETDSPFLAPVPYRGKRNEPAFVKHTARVLADVCRVSVDEVAVQTTRNFYRFFSLQQNANSS
ncbi:MAG: TatD family hydrolase [Acidobacteria bacterium]|nr:TatD family hydrolase [Acidobacteriota bacterium]